MADRQRSEATNGRAIVASCEMNANARNLLPLWAIVVAIALSMHIGSYPLYDADEGRNGEVGREMAATNDYVMPRYDTLPYVDKPIVYFAAEAAAMEILGPTETAARLPAFLFTLLTAALAGWFARRLWSAEAGWIAGIAAMAMPFTLAFSRTVIFDSTLSFFVVLSTIAFYFAVEERLAARAEVGAARLHLRAAFGWRVLAWAAMGAGVLTKGPVAIALPLLIAVPYAIWRRAFRALWSVTGLLAFAALIAPWVIAVSHVVPDFLRYVLVTETAQRLATKALKRTGPPWYFIPYLIGGALPWSFVLIGAAVTAWRERASRTARDPRVVFLLLWLLIPFLFFSISQSKRPQYILPIMPAVALLIAASWQGERVRLAGARTAAYVMTIFGALLAVAPLVVPLEKKMKPLLVAPSRTAAIGIGVAMLAGGIVVLLARERKSLVVAALTLPVLAIPLTGNPLLQAIGTQRSAKELAAIIQPRLTPQTQLVGIEAFQGSLAFYLQRPITIVTPDAEELTSNYLIRHYPQFSTAADSTIRPSTWLASTLGSCCTPRIYIVRAEDRIHRQMLEQRGIPFLAERSHLAAYGPWTAPATMR
jgi:4-amino-4-deoxy-L-arabinose transferase-like glycosyltransferase